MKFHDYPTLRTRMARQSEQGRDWAKRRKPEELRDDVISIYRWASEAGEECSPHYAALAQAESKWAETERPFYNIWPVAAEMAMSVKLELPFSAVVPPYSSIALRFAVGHEPYGVTSALLSWVSDPSGKAAIAVFPVTKKLDEQWLLGHVFSEPDVIVEEWLQNAKRKADYGKIHEHLIRLVVFVGLLANDRDLITPFVLSKDQGKYDATDEEDVRLAIERRAIRRLGRGFDIGKAIQLEKARTPHWRNPHLALFWTGSGRLKPVIKMRRGTIVHRVGMAEVPTGYLGPETNPDAELIQEIPQRVPISTKLRFEVFKRDNYRCRICGACAGDGAALHVDHRIPVVKGGSNEGDNLWTLCDRCNLGKSDSNLGPD